MARTRITTLLAFAATVAMTSPALAQVPAGAAVVPATAAADGDEQAAIDRLEQLVPDQETADLARLHELTRHDERMRALESVIDGSDYQCGPTALDAWLDEAIPELDFYTTIVLMLTDAPSWPTYDALLYGPEGQQTYGLHGEYTKELNKTFGRLDSFWDLDTSDVELMAMHSDMVLDEDRVVRLLTELYGYDEADAHEVFQLVKEVVDTDLLDHGQSPLFTLNAFAYSEVDAPADERLGISDRIVMGDGILQAMDGIGLGDVAPRGILAHEFGHQLQYRLGLFADHAGDAEATRLTEVEADALAGYYLAHAQGERLRTKRVQQFAESFAAVGDCGFDSDGHHGTPGQRGRAAHWGGSLADSAGQKGKHQLGAAQVSDRFRAIVDTLILPDPR